jgi:hypothetical protein
VIRADIAGFGHGEDACATMEALSKRVGAVEAESAELRARFVPMAVRVGKMVEEVRYLSPVTRELVSRYAADQEAVRARGAGEGCQKGP